MAKVTLTFELPQEEEEFTDALHGAHYKFILDDIKNWLRSKNKYEDVEVITIEEVRNKIVELESHWIE